jgi:hypothetical protein
VVLAACLSVAIWYGLVEALGLDPKDEDSPTTLDWIVAGLLAVLAIHIWRGRGEAEVPNG